MFSIILRASVDRSVGTTEGMVGTTTSLRYLKMPAAACSHIITTNHGPKRTVQDSADILRSKPYFFDNMLHEIHPRNCYNHLMFFAPT